MFSYVSVNETNDSGAESWQKPRDVVCLKFSTDIFWDSKFVKKNYENVKIYTSNESCWL